MPTRTNPGTKALQNLFAAALHTVEDAVVAINSRGTIMSVNQQALDLLNDLHRARFRSAGDRTAGENGSEEFAQAHVVAERPGDRGSHLEERLVALHIEQFFNLYRAGLAHASEIVAQKVHDHNVLGAVLLA